jgi:hypothetical protein
VSLTTGGVEGGGRGGVRGGEKVRNEAEREKAYEFNSAQRTSTNLKIILKRNSQFISQQIVTIIFLMFKSTEVVKRLFHIIVMGCRPWLNIEIER